MDGRSEANEEEIERVLSSTFGRQIRLRVDELARKLLPQVEERLRKGHEQQEVHDSILDICASAFGPEGPLSGEVGYRSLSTEPLVELGVPNFDLLIYDSTRKAAIFVEVKSSITKPRAAISQVYEAIDELEKQLGYLQEQIGDEISKMEYVICTPSEEESKLVRELVRQENEGEIDSTSVPLLKVWRVDRFKGQTLSLVPAIASRGRDIDSQHRDRNLTRLLADGVKIEEAEVNVAAYPSSHPLRHARRAIAQNVANRIASDQPIKEFSEDQVREVFESPAYLLQYDRAQIARNLTERFLAKAAKLDLIRLIDGREGWFELNVRGRTLRTILKNFQEGYFAELANRRARRKALQTAIDEFRETHPGLEFFGGEDE